MSFYVYNSWLGSTRGKDLSSLLIELYALFYESLKYLFYMFYIFN